MKYRIQNIGKEFSDKAVKALEAKLNDASNSGYRFHSVIEVSQPGCLGIGQPSVTYLAVFEQL